MKHLFTILLLFTISLFATAQVSFEATLSARQVTLNSYFDVTFTLRNAEGENFNPPNFDNFTVLSGPARSMSTTIVNGRVSNALSYIYTLQPRRKGKFTIGVATVQAEGKTIRTKSLTIEVVESKNLSKNITVGKVFIRAELSTTKAFVGQQITLDYKLYTASNIDSYSTIEESKYPGFYAEDLRRFDTPPLRETVQGVRYVTKILKRVALFPQQAGVLTISPIRLEMGILQEDLRDEGFFFNRQVQRIFVESDAVKVNVTALPPNAPASFSGGVGRFSAAFSLNQTDVSTDDAISLRLSIRGDGDIKRVQSPTLVLPDGFEVYDPKVLEETTGEDLNGGLVGKKEIKYILLPKKAGQFELQPAFSYFDTDKKKYITWNQNRFTLNVRQGTQRATEPVAIDESTITEQDIRFIKTDTNLKKTNTIFFNSPVFWTLSALPFLFLTGVVLVKRKQNKPSNVNETELRIKRARQEAQNRLKTAEQHLKANQSRAFYDEISKSLLGYVCDKLQIAGSVLTKDNVREKLNSLNVEETLLNDFMDIIQTSEVALYSGKDNPAAMNDIYQKSVTNLSKMEESLK